MFGKLVGCEVSAKLGKRMIGCLLDDLWGFLAQTDQWMVAAQNEQG